MYTYLHKKIFTHYLKHFMESVKPVPRALVKDFCIRLQLLQKAEKKGVGLAWLMVCAFSFFLREAQA